MLIGFSQAIITYLIAKKHSIKFAFTSHGSDVQIINNLGPIGKKIVRSVAKNPTNILLLVNSH